jgi:gluconolactonase
MKKSNTCLLIGLIVAAYAVAGCSPFRRAQVPVGADCLPQSPVAKACRDVPIFSHPPTPESSSPQLPLQSYDPSFTSIIGLTPNLVHLAQGFGFTEGPAYLNDRKGRGGFLFFCDLVHNSVYAIHWNGLDRNQSISSSSWDKPVLYRNPAGVIDGQTTSQVGALLGAETAGQRISIIADVSKSLGNPSHQAQTLVDNYKGVRLNGPDDLVVKSDGSVWFTDPSYGSLEFPGQKAKLPNNVYRYDPKAKQLTPVALGLNQPNGIAFSPQEKMLYVIDSGAIQGDRTYFSYLPHTIYSYPVSEDGKTLGERKTFAVIGPGFPDGMRLDEKGNIYVGALDGVHVLNPAGKLIGKIMMPKQTANLTFGGRDNDILFIMSTDSVWAIRLNTRGLVPVRTMS